MVYCKCNKPAQHLVTVKANANHGRWFYNCKTSTCQFFAWDDDTSRRPSMIGATFPIYSSTPSPNIDNTLIKCRCNKPARHLVTKKQNENNGRWFYNCPNNLCGFFLWDDETPRQSTLVNTSEKKLIRDSVKLSLHFFVKSDTHIAVYLDNLNGSNNQEHIASIMNSCATKENSNTWIMPTTKQAYRRAIQALAQERPTSASSSPFDIHPLPKNVIQALTDDDDDDIKEDKKQYRHKGIDTTNPIDRYAEDKEEFNKCMELVQDLDLWQELVSYQREGVKQGIQWKGRMLLGDEMGLGKTVQAIAVAYSYLDEWPVLVVCPSSMRLTWKNELLQWTDLEEQEVGVITQGIQMTQLPKKRKQADAAKVVSCASSSSGGSQVKKISDDYPGGSRNGVKFWVTSYDLATRRIDHIVDAEFEIVICDESHYIKNFTAKRTQALVPVLKKAKRAMLLTGTPALSRPIELFSQISAIRPDIFVSEEEFGERYCGGSAARDDWREYTGAQLLEELHFLLTKTVLVRRLKNDVGNQLPKKRRQVVLMDVPSLGKNQVARVDREGTVFQWYSESGAAKIPVVQQYIEHTLDNTNKKIIIFAYHHSMLDAIERSVSKKKVTYVRIDGTTEHTKRQIFCDAFQAPNSKIRVVILSLVVALGLNLSAADLVLFAELYWNPAHLLQAEDRAHRLGRVGLVDVVYILSMNTIDSFLWPLVRQKLRIIGSAVDGDSSQINLNEESSSTPDWFRGDSSLIKLEDFDSDEDTKGHIVESSSLSVKKEV